MKNSKLRILTLALLAVVVQGTYTYSAYAASSSSNDKYTKEELDNLTPGFENDDIKKSNYKVDSYTNSFSSTQTPTDDSSSSTTAATTTTNSTNSTNNTSTASANTGNIIVSTSPSTGNQGDFWGKTSNGKWILISQGVPQTGWQMVGSQWYYMDSDGVMQTGWINDGENWYYLNSNGTMAYNTIVDGYYLDWSGAMQ